MVFAFSTGHMLKHFLYRRRLDAALLELGIDTTELNPAFHDELLTTGLRDELTPKEVALSVLSVVYPSLSLVDRLSCIHVERKWRSSPQLGAASRERMQKAARAFARTPVFRQR